MSKKILAIYYSQSGQLDEIVENFITPFIDTDIIVEKVRVRTKPEYTFPWTSARFFNAMPESVLGRPVELEPFQLKYESYDLIVFAYQPWYLSPSIPAASILQDASFRRILKGSRVLTLIGARNMWLNAQEKVKKELVSSDATLVGNIVLTDKNSNLISAVTILYWMLTGKRDRYKGIFPKPGVSEEDIHEAKMYGAIVKNFLKKDNWSSLQKELVKSKAVSVEADLMFIEERAGRLFSIWAHFIIKRKNRTFWLLVFKYYLLVALFVIAPIVLTINSLVFKPFFFKHISGKKKYYLGLN